MLHLEQLLAGALDTLARENIEVVLLKGAGLAATVYGSFTARPMYDVDMLLRPDDAPHAWNALRRAGWVHDEEECPPEFYASHYHLPPLDDAQGTGLAVELHSAPTDGAVLLSGDARETCEALGRALDIEHVRPEVLPADRGEEIRRLVASGGSIAVIGRSPVDDSALGAADVAVALDAAGSSTSEWSVQLASDDIKEAAFAIRLAHDTRREARSGLVTALTPALAGALSVAFGLVPPAAAPFAAAAGGLLAVYRMRSPMAS